MPQYIAAGLLLHSWSSVAIVVGSDHINCLFTWLSSPPLSFLSSACIEIQFRVYFSFGIVIVFHIQG